MTVLLELTPHLVLLSRLAAAIAASPLQVVKGVLDQVEVNGAGGEVCRQVSELDRPTSELDRPASVGESAGTESLSHIWVEEVILQSYLFCGFPRTLNALSAWREIVPLAPVDRGGSSSLDHIMRQDTENSLESYYSEGEISCRRIYGKSYERLRGNIRALHPDIDYWMIVEGYGKVLSRPALPLEYRELCIVSACAAAEQLPQLRSHLRGAINLGWGVDDLHHLLQAIADIIGPSAYEAAVQELSQII